MTISRERLFQRLGAPLRVTRQSWGAVRETDGTVFLLVWQDEAGTEDDDQLCCTIHRADRPGTFGLTERLQHIKLIRDGAPCFVIMARSKLPIVNGVREILSINSRELFCTGKLRMRGRDTLIELTGQRIKI